MLLEVAREGSALSHRDEPVGEDRQKGRVVCSFHKRLPHMDVPLSQAVVCCLKMQRRKNVFGQHIFAFIIYVVPRVTLQSTGNFFKYSHPH